MKKFETASFDVDATNCFTPLCPLELPVEGGDKIVPELNGNATKARLRIMSKDAHPSNAKWQAFFTDPDRQQMSKVYDSRDMDVFWNMHSVPGTFGFELIKGLPHPREYDFILYKGAEPDMHPYSAVYHDHAKRVSTGVIEFLKFNGIKNVILGGLALNFGQQPMCLGETAIDLFECGKFEHIIINLGATASINNPNLSESANQRENNDFIRRIEAKTRISFIKTYKEILIS